MAKTLKIIITLIIASMFFGAGYLYNSINSWFNSPVEVLIKNQSQYHLKSIKLLFSSQVSGVLEIPNTYNMREVKLGYFPSGEGSFVLEATFDSGKIVKYSEGYVEAGYTFDLVLTDNKFKRNP